MAIQLEIIEKSGAWFYYDGDRLGQGKDNVRKCIESDPEFMAKLEGMIRDRVQNQSFSEDELGASDEDFEIKDFADEF